MLKIRTGKRSMWSVKLAVRWNLRHGKAADYVLGLIRRSRDNFRTRQYDKFQRLQNGIIP